MLDDVGGSGGVGVCELITRVVIVDAAKLRM